ncbi:MULTISPECIES: oligoendopeptidase F [Allobacillus]|uniref:Oligopeptidase F n=1 Tax=Allobacillus halotolerans TaxID=570278 RepID=A0ABS6GSA1_9BACI|nr:MULTISPECIES: oligoendopeptidase F [Allobacillus]MBU6081500.1 oligoendopeptidase F [Allobacillus halotolerans]TSJ63438.1 oligoendopeptidase F [Allobacillus sp. SKP2-8]
MSEESTGLKTREEVPTELTWNLEAIFSTDEEWEEEFEALKEEYKKVEKFKGTLADSPENLLKLFQFEDEFDGRLEKLYVYAHMRSDQDTTNSKYQDQNARAASLATEAMSAFSFVTPEILGMSDEQIESFLTQNEELKTYEKTLRDIMKSRPHVLSEKEEVLLAKSQEVSTTAGKTFGMLDNADIELPKITNEEGEEVQLSSGRYREFLDSKDREVRKSAFLGMHNTYKSFKNTFAATLSGQVKGANFYADARNYDSARAASLDRNNIPEKVYDQLVDAVNDRLPSLHRFMDLKKKVLGVDELHMYDIYTPLVDEKIEVTIDEAKEHVLEGLKPLGEEYNSILQKAYNERWIDWLETKGKRSGAYSSGSYLTRPYILMNWNDNIDNLFTLAHELGHSLHSYYTHQNQNKRYGSYSIFVAEVASTANEALLNDYLLKTLEDKNKKLYLLNNFLEGFRATFFRQTMFAEFEHEIHQRDQNGEALTADKLTSIYYDLNKKYFGNNVHVDEEIGYEWARIPHFYMNYYVYQYATGYAAATTLADKILTEGEVAVERYKDYLKAGRSEDPIDVLKKAGVDMTTKDPIYKALDVFDAKLDEFEKLLAE